MSAAKDKKLNYEEFFRMAILKLRDTSKSRGIHSVFSGFNEAFREYFNKDPIEITQRLAAEGKIQVRFAKRGVMLYLPDEAPESRSELGKKALSRILGDLPEQQSSLLEKVLAEVCPGGIKSFPDDFVPRSSSDDQMIEVPVPGTPLQLAPKAKAVVVSPKRRFRYVAKNPPEARYIIYGHKLGQKMIKVPNDNRAVFKAVTTYEKYCDDLRHQCFTVLLRDTHDEDIAELLTEEAAKKLGLRARPKPM